MNNKKRHYFSFLNVNQIHTCSALSRNNVIYIDLSRLFINCFDSNVIVIVEKAKQNDKIPLETNKRMGLLTVTNFIF